MQKLTTAFEPAPHHGAGSPDYIVRLGLLFGEFSATTTRLSLPAKDHGTEAISLELHDANVHAPAAASERLEGQSNYLLGADPAAWRTHVPQFGRITYTNVYPGIDLTYYGTTSRLEHDFIVHQGASPSSIRLHVGGAQALSLAAKGELQIQLKDRVVVLQKPIAYQMRDGHRSTVAVEFALAGDTASFRLGDYDRSLPLVIDPVLDYSTFLGDASVYVTGVAVDAAGNTYISGGAPTAYPASTGTPACNGCLAGTNRSAAFVTKLNAAGTGILYSTFIGGNVDPYGSPSTTQPSLLAVDSSGDAIVSGWTSAADFPLKNAIAAGVPSFADGFVTSLSPDGASLVFSSRVGGSSSGSSSASTYPGALAVDRSGNVYLAGSTESPYLPVTSGALHNASPLYAAAAGFLMKLSPAGALSFSGIVGALGSASGGVGPSGIAVDNTGVISMVGTAGAVTVSSPTSTPWPTTPGAYQTNLVNSAENAPFVTRVSADGSAILSSTLLGSGSASGMALTPSHDVILTGVPGYNFPLTSDAFNKNIATNANGNVNQGASCFFAKVSADGTRLLYSSAFGPSDAAIYIHGVALDSGGNLWLAGTSNSTLTDLVHPLQSVHTYGTATGFVSKFDPALHTLLFETYINSATGSSQVNGLALDSSDHAHVGGAASQDFPTTPNAHLRTVTPPPPGYDYTYGFAAAIDASTPGPGICFANQNSPNTVFGTKGSGSFDIVSCGDAPLTLSSLQLTSNAFTLTSHCEGALAPGQSCTVSYSFSPTKIGTATAQVSIASDAPLGPSLWTISATGTAPVVYFPFSSSYTFATQVIGTPPQSGMLTLGNKGTAPLVVDNTRTTISGPFTLGTTTCTAPLDPGNICTIGITFNPTSAGPASGSVIVYTNDPATPSVAFNLSGAALTNYPAPVIAQLAIPSISLDGGVANITINGSGFFPASTVLVNGYSAPVTSTSDTSITASVDPATLGSLREYPVQVVNPAPGGPSNIVTLAAYHLLPLNSTVVVSNPVTKLLYAAIPSTSATNPNTVVPVDPTTGKLGTPIPVLTNPTHLALSDDGRYLYVSFYYLYGSSSPAASLQRIDLQAGAVDRTFTLPGSSNGIISMHAVPGSPTSLLVALSRSASPSENGAALFGDSGLLQYLPNDFSTKYLSLDQFTFTADPSTYYGYPFAGSFFSTGTLTATTITPLNAGGGSCCDQASGSLVVSDGTLLYTNSGQVWNPKTKTLLGSYDNSLFYEAGVLADALAKRTFILRASYQPTDGFVYPAISSYDPSTSSLAGVLYFAVTGGAGSLTRWGTDGFSFLTGNSTFGDFTNPTAFSQLLLVRSSLATPGAPGASTIVSLSPSLIAAGSPSLTLTVNGSNFTAASTVLWNGAIRTTTFVSATQLTAAISAADLASAGTVPVTVSTGGNATPALPFTVAKTGLTISPASLSFPTQTVGLASSAQTITIQNAGLATVSAIALSLTGTDGASFTQSSTCGATLAPGATCNVSVTFTPASPASKQAMLNVASNSGTQTVALTGVGALPALTLSAQSIDFGQVMLGSSTSKTVTLQNSGSVPLANVAIGFSGSNSADFAQTSTCSTSLVPTASCTVTITFTPSAAGTRSATLNIGAYGASAQSITLTGISAAPDFALPAPAAPSAQVTAGQSATFSLSLSQSGGFSGPVTMSCSNLPAYASCTFSPATFSFGAGSTATVALSIATQQTVTALKQTPHPRYRSSSLVALAALVMFPLFSRRVRLLLLERSTLLMLCLSLSLAMGLVGCGGSQSSSNQAPTPTPQRTAPGTYSVTVSASSGSTSHSTIVTLIVQ